MNHDCDPITDASGAAISLEDAIEWTGNYQSNHPNGLRSVYFSTSVFEALLAQPGTEGIRIYLANSSTSSENLDTMILVSATESADLTATGTYTLYDHGTGTPPCSVVSPLNPS